MLDRLTAEDFGHHLDTRFAVDRGDSPAIDLVLAQVRVTGSTPWREGGRLPYALELLGPPTELLPQATYTLRHDALGELAVFLVPVGRDATGVRYEAIFN